MNDKNSKTLAVEENKAIQEAARWFILHESRWRPYARENPFDKFLLYAAWDVFSRLVDIAGVDSPLMDKWLDEGTHIKRDYLGEIEFTQFNRDWVSSVQKAVKILWDIESSKRAELMK